MKLKIKLTQKKVFQGLYVLLIFINIAAIFKLYNFINTYVYDAFFVDSAYIMSQSNILANDININKFNTLIDNINKKTKKNNVENITNAF